jgi:hypothetical protein
MDLKIYKDKRNTGKYHHKAPFEAKSTSTKKEVVNEISRYIEENSDFGDVNYLLSEYRITTKLDPYSTYRYEDLY